MNQMQARPVLLVLFEMSLKTQLRNFSGKTKKAENLQHFSRALVARRSQSCNTVKSSRDHKLTMQTEIGRYRPRAPKYRIY